MMEKYAVLRLLRNLCILWEYKHAVKIGVFAGYEDSKHSDFPTHLHNLIRAFFSTLTVQNKCPENFTIIQSTAFPRH